MIKLGIISYFTGVNYNNTQLILDWLNNMRMFYCVEQERTFIIYTDNQQVVRLQRLFNDVVVNIVPQSQTRNRDDNLRAKFFYIQDFIEKHDGFDYISFIQSNCRCRNRILMRRMIDRDDVSLNVSSWFMVKRNVNFYAWGSHDIQDLYDKFDTVPYIQAGHFIGKVRRIYEVSSWINTRMTTDIQHGIYLKVHDESYLNLYFQENRFNKLTLMNGLHFLSHIQTKGEIIAVDKKKLFPRLPTISPFATIDNKNGVAVIM